MHVEVALDEGAPSSPSARSASPHCVIDLAQRRGRHRSPRPSGGGVDILATWRGRGPTARAGPGEQRRRPGHARSHRGVGGPAGVARRRPAHGDGRGRGLRRAGAAPSDRRSPNRLRGQRHGHGAGRRPEPSGQDRTPARRFRLATFVAGAIVPGRHADRLQRHRHRRWRGAAHRDADRGRRLLRGRAAPATVARPDRCRHSQRLEPGSPPRRCSLDAGNATSGGRRRPRGRPAAGGNGVTNGRAEARAEAAPAASTPAPAASSAPPPAGPLPPPTSTPNEGDAQAALSSAAERYKASAAAWQRLAANIPAPWVLSQRDRIRATARAAGGGRPPANRGAPAPTEARARPASLMAGHHPAGGGAAGPDRRRGAAAAPRRAPRRPGLGRQGARARVPRAGSPPTSRWWWSRRTARCCPGPAWRR